MSVHTFQICSNTHTSSKSPAGLTENNEKDTDCLDAPGPHWGRYIHQQYWSEFIRTLVILQIASL